MPDVTVLVPMLGLEDVSVLGNLGESPTGQLVGGPDALGDGNDSTFVDVMIAGGGGTFYGADVFRGYFTHPIPDNAELVALEWVVRMGSAPGSTSVFAPAMITGENQGSGGQVLLTTYEPAFITYEINAVSYWDDFLDRLRAGTITYAVQSYTIGFVDFTGLTRISDVRLRVTYHLEERLPFTRLYPREDKYSPSRRLFPRPRSVQTPGRLTGYR